MLMPAAAHQLMLVATQAATATATAAAAILACLVAAAPRTALEMGSAWIASASVTQVGARNLFGIVLLVTYFFCCVAFS
jgi:hypothetical protein